jgi:8-oxo-dGTP diphosphatase
MTPYQAYLAFMAKAAARVQDDLPRRPPGVRAVVQNDRGEILLLQRPETALLYPGTWNLPGGKKDPGESFLEGAHRELREETGLEAEYLKRKYKYNFMPEARGTGHAFLFRHPAGDIKFPEREVSRYGWFKPDALPEKLFPQTKYLVDTLLPTAPPRT